MRPPGSFDADGSEWTFYPDVVVRVFRLLFLEYIGPGSWVKIKGKGRDQCNKTVG